MAGSKLQTKKTKVGSTGNPLDIITFQMKGWILVTYLNGEQWKTENLRLTHKFTKEIKQYNIDLNNIETVEDEGSGEELIVSANLTEKMAQTYASLKYKYSRKRSSYSSKGKYWMHFQRAAGVAKKYDLDAYEYITIIRNHYTSRVRENKLSFPWPAQIGGPAADEIISNHLANKSSDIPEEVIALRMAQAKRNLPLDKDEYFIEAKSKFKARTFTRKDFEYVKIRYTQVGETPDWLDRFEKILDEREAEARKFLDED